MIKYEDNVSARLSGNTLQPLAGVFVTVTDNVTGLPAFLYEDVAGAKPIQQGTLTTDDNGYFGFYIPDGEYTVQFSGSRFAPFTRQIAIQDPDSNVKVNQLASPAGAALVGFGSHTLADKLNESISVTDKGANKTGAVDMTAAAQAAIDALPAYGGEVFFPPGKYRLDGTLTLRSGVSLTGAGKSASELWFGAAGKIVLSGTIGSSAGNLRISKLGLTNQGGGAVTCLALSRVAHIAISQCVVYNTNITVSGYNYVTVTECDLYGGKLIADHPDVNGISEALKIDLCSGSGYAVDVKDSTDFVFTRTHLLGASAYLKVQRGEENSAFYGIVYISDSVIDSTDDECIYLSGVSPQVSNVFVSGGRTNNKSGMYLFDCIEGAFANVRARYCGKHGVDINSCNGLAFTGGVFNDNKTYGVRLADSTNLQFLGTQARNAPSWFGGNYVQQNGIADQPGNCTNVQVIGCNCAGNAVSGAFLPSSSNVLVGNIGV